MDEDKVLELIAIEHRRVALKLELDELDRQEEELKTAIMSEMEDSKLDVFENEEIRIKYIAPVIKETLDTYKIKKEYPEIAENCRKQVEQKATWKITLKGE